MLLVSYGFCYVWLWKDSLMDINIGNIYYDHCQHQMACVNDFLLTLIKLRTMGVYRVMITDCLLRQPWVLTTVYHQ